MRIPIAVDWTHKVVPSFDPNSVSECPHLQNACYRGQNNGQYCFTLYYNEAVDLIRFGWWLAKTSRKKRGK